MDKEETAAFFDLDGTLLTVNSLAMWAKREHRLGNISLRQLLEGGYYSTLYRFRGIDINRAGRKALATIRGLREEHFARRLEHWFYKELIDYVAPKAAEVLESHRERDHVLVLLTSATQQGADIAARYFGIEHVIATRFELVDGRFTGDVIPPICYGEGKVDLAMPFVKSHNIDLAKSYFYTDSFTDIPMLKKVGNPRAVNPDFRLLLTSKRAGWPILDWRR